VRHFTAPVERLQDSSSGAGDAEHNRTYESLTISRRKSESIEAENSGLQVSVACGGSRRGSPPRMPMEWATDGEKGA